jgi:uncharacterized protein YndB with AHSA1/START domain
VSGLVVEREIFIAARPETVFPFFIEPTLMARWLGIRHELQRGPAACFSSK